jgi:hypothetical protein
MQTRDVVSSLEMEENNAEQCRARIDKGKSTRG